MITHDLNGFVLHIMPGLKNQWQLMMLTREQGRLTAWKRRPITSKPALCLQPFVPLWMILHANSRGFLQVHQIEAEKTPALLSGEALLAGWYVNELLMYLLCPHEPDPQLFDAYVQTIDALRVAKDKHTLERILRQFEWILLQSLGQAISLTTEARTLEAIDPMQHYRCIPTEGLIAAHQGIVGAACLALAQGDWRDPVLVKAMKPLMRLLIDHVLEGRRLKTRQLYRSLQVSTSQTQEEISNRG